MPRVTSLLPHALIALLASTALADTTVSGFRLAAHDNPRFAAATCTLPGGDIVTFDGQSVERWKPSGTFVSSLGQIPSPGSASFVLPTPDGLAVILGESTTHNLYTANIDGSGVFWVTNVTFNYAAAFAPTGELYVSAATQGYGNGNDILRVNLAPPSAVIVGHVVGPSGPLAVDSNGDLYYGTQDPLFPPASGSSNIVFWSAAQVANGGLNDANATTFATGFDGAASLAFDPVTGKLFLAESNFFLGVSNVVRVHQDKAHSPRVASAANPIASVEIFNVGGGTASFDPYQPSNGSNLRYNTTDFMSVSQLVTVRPLRPTLVASGAGTTGVGPVTLTLGEGVPSGSMYVFFCPQSAYSPIESTYNYPGFLLHTGLTPSLTRRVPFLLPTDASGAGSFTLWNPGTLSGQFAFQVLVGDAQGTFVGSSSATLF